MEPNSFDVQVTLLRTHQLRVTWADHLPMIYPNGLEGARWLQDGNGWTIPALGATDLMLWLRTRHPDLRVSFDRGSATLIFEALQREANTNELAIAEDGDTPEVLSVPSRNFQRAALAYLLRGNPRKIVALDTGLGKTFVAAAYTNIRQARTLWITKAALDENLMCEIHKLTGLKATRLIGTIPSPTAQHILLDTSVQHIVMTYEQLASGIRKTETGDSVSLWGYMLSVSPFDLLVCDEAHNLRNRSSNRYHVVSMLAKSIPSALLLTATPLVNNGDDLFSLLHLLDKSTFGSVVEFQRMYTSYNGKTIRNPEKLRRDLLPFMFRRDKKEVLKDLPPVIRSTHNVNLDDEWRKKYLDIMQGIYRDLAGRITDVPNSVLAQITRCRQVCSAAKVEHTVELARNLEEQGEKCLVFTAFKETSEVLAKELFCDVINGDMDKENRIRIRDRFMNDPNVKHLVLTLGTGGEGLTLTKATAAIMNDYAWTPIAHQQAEGRAWGRLNDLHGLLVYYVSISNTVDEFMLQTLKRKQTMIDQAVDGQRSFAEANASMLSDFIAYVVENKGRL
jgi:SNF2 family DNA or RNA helicase